MEKPSSGRNRSPVRWLQPLVGAVLFLVAGAFCVRAIVDEWDRVDEALSSAHPAMLVLALGLAGAAMGLIALGWRHALVMAGAPVLDRKHVVAWYFMGELGKYVPGSVWSVVGRGELARSRAQITRHAAYASVVLSLAALYGAAVLPAGLVALHPRVLQRIRHFGERVTRRRLDLPEPAYAEIIRLLVAYLPVWVLVAGCTLATASALDAGGSPLRLAAATIVAWVAGFAAVPVPAGAGVREVVFVALAGLPPGVGVVVAVVARLCFVAVDAAGAAIGFLLYGRQRTPDS